MSIFRKWGALLVLSAAAFIIVIDTTIMNVSIGTLVKDLNTTVTGIQGAITLYSLVMAAFFITGGKIGDIIGRKKAFLIGIMIYGVGTVLTSIAWNLGVLMLGWSIIEGLGAALMLPILQTLLRGNYEQKELPLCYGIIGAVNAGAAALGPLIGGFLTTAWTWRVAFFGQFIIVLIVLFFSRAVKDLKADKKASLDILGVLLSATGLGVLVFGVVQASTYGWIVAKKPFVIGGAEIAPFGLSITVVFAVIGIVLLIGFLLWEGHLTKIGKSPLISLTILKIRNLRRGVSLSLLQNIVQMGILFCIPLLLQISFNYSAFKSGLVMLPFSLSILALSLLGAKLGKKLFPKSIILSGFILMTLGIVVLIVGIYESIESTHLWPGFLVAGAGIGLVVYQMVNFVLSLAPEESVSEASGLNATCQQLGASLGTAIAGTVLLTVLGIVVVNGAQSNQILTQSQKDAVVKSVNQNVEFLSNSELEKLLVNAPPDAAQAIIDINSEARIQAIRMALLSLTIFSLLGIFIAFRLPKNKLR